MDGVLRFSRLVSQPTGRFDLFVAAVAIGGAQGHRPDFAAANAEIERLAQDVDSVEALRIRLFEEEGFCGDTDTYDTPGNSFVHDVLRRRRGIPVTLSLIAAEVGKRRGLDLRLIGMPGHMIVRDGADGVFFDPFYGGEVLDRAGCERRFREATAAGDQVAFTDELLAETPPVAVLVRILENLNGVYRRAGSLREQERVLRMRRSLPGFSLGHLLELGEVITAQGNLETAVAELEAATPRAPAYLTATLRGAIHSLRSRLN